MKKLFIRWQRFLTDEKIAGRLDTFFTILLVIVVLVVLCGYIHNIFRIPINKPYFSGQWDEPFAINAGINVIRSAGNPIFYNYGGTTTYIHALVFYFYCKQEGMVPHFKRMAQELKGPTMLMSRKIYPVKPIFITKVVAYILFLLGAFILIGSFIIFLLPAAFWLIPMITSNKLIGHMANQMLPETHITILAGLTSIFFARAVLEKDISKYFKWVVIISVFASLTIAAKINTLYIVFLPLSLLIRLFKEKYITVKRMGIVAAGLVLPYILVNPAVIFNFTGYKDWLVKMYHLGETTPGMWMNRTSQIFPFIKNLYLFNVLPAVILIGLLILSCILMIKKNPAAFAGFMFFILYSLAALTNMKHAFWGRHLMFLILPLHLLILFPLVLLFQKIPKRLKAGVTLLCLVITLWTFPPAQTVHNILKLKDAAFTTQWKKESRDELEAFVKSSGAKLFFYDHHGFSLPNTIRHRVIPFADPDKLPDRLEPNEYVALILYKNAKKGINNKKGIYNTHVGRLLKKYTTVKIFGKPGGAHNINKQVPFRNPTILLLKNKKQGEK